MPPLQPLPYEPPETDVIALIHAARQHPLGEEFLLRGHLGSVAITFGCHAFTVVAARDRLTELDKQRKAS